MDEKKQTSEEIKINISDITRKPSMEEMLSNDSKKKPARARIAFAFDDRLKEALIEDIKNEPSPEVFNENINTESDTPEENSNTESTISEKNSDAKSAASKENIKPVEAESDNNSENLSPDSLNEDSSSDQKSIDTEKPSEKIIEKESTVKEISNSSATDAIASLGDLIISSVEDLPEDTDTAESNTIEADDISPVTSYTEERYPEEISYNESSEDSTDIPYNSSIPDESFSDSSFSEISFADNYSSENENTSEYDGSLDYNSSSETDESDSEFPTKNIKSHSEIPPVFDSFSEDEEIEEISLKRGHSEEFSNNKHNHHETSNKKDKIHTEKVHRESKKTEKEFSYSDSSISGGTKISIIAGLVAAIVLIGYFTCCFLAGGSGVLGHTYIGDYDLIDMSRSEAQKEIADLYNQAFSNASINVSVGDQIYNIKVFDAMISPAKDVAKEAVSFGHGMFLGRGFDYIRSILSYRDLDINPREINEGALLQSINNSNIVQDHSGSDENWRLTDNELIIVKSEMKSIVDENALVQELTNAILEGNFEQTIECPITQVKAESTDIQSIYDSIYVAAKNATVDPENIENIIESENGLEFDLDAAISMLNSASDGQTVTIPLIHTEAEVTADTLRANLFRDVMGTYSTNVRGSADRRSNVKLAAMKCNKIMLPGDVFSYNETVGKRTAEAGFFAAPAYSNGNTIQELGGGICQSSSTLYNACVIANLEIVERHNHSFASSYVPLGQDATVSWGGPDFKFANNTNYPIKIEAIYENDKVTFNIIGTNETGEYCSLTNEVLSTNPYQTVEQASDQLAFGERKRSVEGETGYKVKTYRHLFNAEGKEISVTEEDTSNYIRRDEVVLVGTGLPADMLLPAFSLDAFTIPETEETGD